VSSFSETPEVLNMPNGYCWLYSFLLEISIFMEDENLQRTAIDRDNLKAMITVIKSKTDKDLDMT